MKRVFIIGMVAALAAAAWASPPRYAFEGKWGSLGSGNGQFNFPAGLAVDAAGSRVYVGDSNNYRVQYFKWVYLTVSPASLGRVKALFK